MAQKKQKSQAQKKEIMTKWQDRCAMQAIKALLPENLEIKSHTPVRKEVRKKTAPHPEVYTTIWCIDEHKESILVLYNGSKIKMIPEHEVKESYIVRTIKA